MSDKRSYENKTMTTETPEMPRTYRDLISDTAELRAAVQRHDRGALLGLLEQAEKSWKKARSDNLSISRSGGPMAILEAYADALNDANTVMAAARVALMHG